MTFSGWYDILDLNSKQQILASILLKKHILQGNNINGKVRFFLGYSGWEYEQLIQEIKENTWLIAKEEASYLLNGEAKDMWKNTLGKLGSKYETWSRFPQVPSLN